MSLSPIKPRDGSKEEQERYKADLKSKQENPGLWGVRVQKRKPIKSLPSQEKKTQTTEVQKDYPASQIEKEEQAIPRKAGRPKKSL